MLLTVSVASMSDPKTTAYTVTLYKDTAPWCTCAAQRFAVAKRPCKHIRSVLAASTQRETEITKDVYGITAKFLPGWAPPRREPTRKPTNEFANVLGPNITMSAALLGTTEDESFEFRGVHRA